MRGELLGKSENAKGAELRLCKSVTQKYADSNSDVCKSAKCYGMRS